MVYPCIVINALSRLPNITKLIGVHNQTTYVAMFHVGKTSDDYSTKRTFHEVG